MQNFFLILVGGFIISCATNAPKLSGVSVDSTSFFKTVPISNLPSRLDFDAKETEYKIEHFRRMPAYSISASSTFGPKAWPDFKRRIKAQKQLNRKNKRQIYFFDLRKEPHGLINDKPVTWLDDRNWVHASLDKEEALSKERILLKSLVVGDKIHDEEIRSIESVESMVLSEGYRYIRLSMVEGVRPSDSEVDFLFHEMNRIPKDSWIHFVDQDGKGRSTIVLLLCDMWMSAHKESFDVIVKRNLDLSQDPDALFIGDDKNWKYPFQSERNEFLREFYNYATLHPHGEGQTWSDWVKR